MKTLEAGAPAIVAGARRAAAALSTISTAEKNAVLDALADALLRRAPHLLEANARDLQDAESAGRRPALVDRLRLTPQRIEAIAEGVRGIARLDDPVGHIEEMSRRPNGMLVGKMRVPIGVILMVYEARPNVTVDAAALCLKSGNAAILRGGSEALHSNMALAAVFDDAGLPAGAVQVLDDPDRSLVSDLLQAEGIDLVIPRGGEGLIRAVAAAARMPVLKHFKGICHLFVDRDADLAMATAIVLNAKTHRPSTCNALETLLVDRAVAAEWLPGAVQSLRDAGVEVRGSPEVLRLNPLAVPAVEEDWVSEYLDLVLAVRVVADIEEAIAHIRRYGTGLADGIITGNHAHAMRFVQAVDSAAVLVNASTRLVDGGEFGLGAEIGISTNRIGPRGPMGLRELTIEKWIVLGSGQVR